MDYAFIRLWRGKTDGDIHHVVTFCSLNIGFPNPASARTKSHSTCSLCTSGTAALVVVQTASSPPVHGNILFKDCTF